MFTQEQRQTMRCGFLPIYDGGRAWCHVGMDLGDDGDGAPTVCPGYTTRLPEVIEASRARLHWSKGSLREYLGDSSPTELLMDAIVTLEVEANDAERWSIDNPVKT